MHRIFANKMEHRRISAAAWLLLLASLMVSVQVSAATAGRLLFARGVVEVLHDGAQPHRVIRGDMVNVGDTIRTGAKASAQIRLTDGAMIALRSDSLFKIEQQVYNKEKPEGNSQAAKLLRGGLRAITGAIGHERPSAVKLSTPVATIGIRGTVYDTIYVPPEGLPGLPDVPPGHYTMVLKGRVSMSNPAGELLLGVGEIGYVADANTPPVLRPDLSWMFAKYATLHEDVGGSDDTNDSGDVSPTITPIDNVLTETAIPQQGVTRPGPYAMAITNDISVYQGTFADSVATLGSGGELVYATGGTGGQIYTFDATAAVQAPTSTGTATSGDSTINWGEYGYMDVSLTDASGSPISTTLNVQYIDATQVMANLSDLPTAGSFTYNYVGGAGFALDSTSSLVVDFANSTMSVNLDSTTYGDSWTASNKSISNFYGNGVSLTSSTLGSGSISGRFVGSNADGAMTSFWLDIIDGNVAGVAAFTR